MAFPGRAISKFHGMSPSAKLSKPRFEASPKCLYLKTPVGLEGVLERELQGLDVSGEMTRGQGCIVLEGPEENLWRVPIKSRLITSMRVRIGKSFFAPYEATLQNHANFRPWSEYIRFGEHIQVPEVKVRTENSRLYHAKMIKRRVESAIVDNRNELLRRLLQELKDHEFYRRPDQEAKVASTVYVEIVNNICQFSVDAVMAPHRRFFFHAAQSSKSCFSDENAVGFAPLGEAHAAACVYRSRLAYYLKRCGDMSSRLVVLDPFCGSGTMLLEALGICMGIPPASPRMHFPFFDFPSFDEGRFQEVVESVDIVPHPALSELVLLGTESNATYISNATCNLKSFQQTMPQSTDSPLPGGVGADLPCVVRFHQADSILDIAREEQDQPKMILTNVPYGSKSAGVSMEHVYAEFGNDILELASWGNLQCVYCVSAREDFKRYSGLQWRVELRFLNVGIWVELLRWTGRTAKKALPRQRRRRR